MLEILLTREDANSETALLVEWLVADGDEVRKGQPVCVIETSKSTIEIESPGDGTIRQLAPAGTEVDLGRRIAAVAANADELARLDRERPSEPAKPPAGGPAKATRKAVELAAEHGIDLSQIAKAGFITVEDVQALIAGRQGTSQLPDSGPLAGISLERVSLPDSLGLDETIGVLDLAFLDSLRSDPDVVRALSEEERLVLYRAHGARIGEGVRLGERTVVVSPRIVLDDGVEIGDDSTISCDDVLCIGALTKFEARLRLSCRRTFIGAGGYFSEDVHIGGGGIRDPEALLAVGDLAFVGHETFINPCRPVVIGREVFVTMRSVLITHNVGHSLLEGFENRFAPIVLEDRCQVGIGAVIYAGCRVGAESIVVSNSYVVSDIPPGKLATGVPARVAGNAHRVLSRSRQIELAERMMADLAELLRLRGHDVDAVSGGFAIRSKKQPGQVLFTERIDDRFAPTTAEGETVVLALDVPGPVPESCSVLDLTGRRIHGSGGVVLDSVREFCRKRGIRFEPGPWRYRGGLV